MPGVVAAGLAALAAAGAVLVAGLLIALVTPDASILGLVGRDGGLISEGFRQAVSTLLAPVVDTGPLSSALRAPAPMIFVAIPIGAVASRRAGSSAHRGRPAGGPDRVGRGRRAAVRPADARLRRPRRRQRRTNVSPSAGNAFALGPAVGRRRRVLGAATALPLEGARRAPARRRCAGSLTAATATLRPLGALLIACTALGLVGWLVQVGADVDEVRAGRSRATALVEESLFVGEHGVHLAALAAGARFTADANGALGLPFPVEQAGDVPGATAASGSSPTPT